MYLSGYIRSIPNFITRSSFTTIKLVISGLICLIGLHSIPIDVYFEVSNLESIEKIKTSCE